MPFKYGLFQILLTITNILFSLWFVVGLGMNWQGRIEGQILTFVLFAVISFGILWKGKWLTWKPEWSYIHNALKFGVPLIPYQLGGWAILMVDRLFITKMVGLTDTGMYTVGYQIGMIIGLIESSFNQAWQPWLFEQLKKEDPNIKVKIVRITYVYFAIIITLALLLSLIAPLFIKYFVGKAFIGSSQFVIWIALGCAFTGMYKMVANYIFYVQRTFFLSVVTFLTAILHIILNYFLILKNGSVGAAQATTLSLLISFIIAWIISQRVYKMPFFKSLTQ